MKTRNSLKVKSAIIDLLFTQIHSLSGSTREGLKNSELLKIVLTAYVD